eukprot:tig00020830_g14462.t1
MLRLLLCRPGELPAAEAWRLRRVDRALASLVRAGRLRLAPGASLKLDAECDGAGLGRALAAAEAAACGPGGLGVFCQELAFTYDHDLEYEDLRCLEIIAHERGSLAHVGDAGGDAERLRSALAPHALLETLGLQLHRAFDLRSAAAAALAAAATCPALHELTASLSESRRAGAGAAGLAIAQLAPLPLKLLCALSSLGTQGGDLAALAAGPAAPSLAVFLRALARFEGLQRVENGLVNARPVVPGEALASLASGMPSLAAVGFRIHTDGQARGLAEALRAYSWPLEQLPELEPEAAAALAEPQTLASLRSPRPPPPRPPRLGPSAPPERRGRAGSCPRGR